jgi:hypothetical protein
VTTNRQKRRLANETETNREEVKSRWPENPCAHRNRAPGNGGEEAKGRDDEKLSIHGTAILMPDSELAKLLLAPGRTIR